jgi:glucose 1-dehydrogenase
MRRAYSSTGRPPPEGARLSDRAVGRLEGKSIIVTGGSSGLGRAMALRFAAEGADVIVGDLHEEPREGGRPTVDAIREQGGRAAYVQADASNPADIARLVHAAVERTGRLDVMVPNAILAGRHSKGLLETSEEDWDAIMAVGLRGVFLACKAAVAQMLSQEPVAEARGRIVNVSSQHGMVGPPGHVAYAAAKGGVVNLTRQIAVDFGPRGIVCNAVAPGKILTTPIDEPDTAETLAYSHARTPFPRLGRPEDVAALAVFLASDDCSYMSGANVLVDGGWMAY